MVILDTNHYSEFYRGSEEGVRLRQRIVVERSVVVISVPTLEEALKGRLAQASVATNGKLIQCYARLQEEVKALNNWLVLPWSEVSATHFQKLKPSLRTKVGTQDLRIASIALAFDAIVLTRNLVDFEKVPGLRVENWLD